MIHSFNDFFWFFLSLYMCAHIIMLCLKLRFHVVHYFRQRMHLTSVKSGSEILFYFPIGCVICSCQRIKILLAIGGKFSSQLVVFGKILWNINISWWKWISQQFQSLYWKSIVRHWSLLNIFFGFVRFTHKNPIIKVYKQSDRPFLFLSKLQKRPNCESSNHPLSLSIQISK